VVTEAVLRRGGGLGARRLDGGIEDLREALAIVGVEVVKKVLSDQLLGIPPQKTLARRALIENPSVDVEDGDEVGGVLQQGAEVLLAKAQGILGVALLGDVLDDPEGAARHTVERRHRGAGEVDPLRISALGLDRDRVLLRAGAGAQEPLLRQPLAHLGLDQQLVGALADQLVEGVTGDVAEAGVGKLDDALGIDLEDSLVHGLDHGPIASLAVLEPARDRSLLLSRGEPALADGEAQLQGGEPHGLRKIVIGPGLERGAHRLDALGRRQHQGVGAVAVGQLVNLPAEFDGSLIDLQVDQHIRAAMLLEVLAGAGGVGAGDDSVPAAEEELLQLLSGGLFRDDQQDLHRQAALPVDGFS